MPKIKVEIEVGNEFCTTSYCYIGKEVEKSKRVATSSGKNWYAMYGWKCK